MLRNNWMKIVFSIMLYEMVVITGGCDRHEDLVLKARLVRGRDILTVLGSIARKRDLVCGDERGHEISDLPSLSAPVVVLCSEFKDNIDLRAEVNTDTAVMQIFAISGGLRLGSPPAESLAKAIRQEIMRAIPGAVVEIKQNTEP